MLKGEIDPGHGGPDPGAIGPGKTHEADVNLIISKLVGGYLKDAGLDIGYTRETDIRLGTTLNADLTARADIANKSNADFFISIHCNSAAGPSAHGIEVFTSRGDTKSDKLATSVIASLEPALPELAFRKDRSDGDDDKEANFAVLTRTGMLAILIEMAFISNPAEEKLLTNPEFQKRIARAIADGVLNYYGIPIPVRSVQAGPEQWKLDIIEDAKKAGLIAGDHDPDESAPKWFVLKVSLNTLKKSALV